MSTELQRGEYSVLFSDMTAKALVATAQTPPAAIEAARDHFKGAGNAWPEFADHVLFRQPDDIEPSALSPRA
jgi:hypothetical protein